MPAIYYLSFDNAFPTGGNKKAYRHVEILGRNGFDACVLHHTAGFRYTQFAHHARTASIPEVRLQRDDVLVVPEDYGPQSATLAAGLRKVVFNQNAYFSFRKYPLEAGPVPTPYLSPDYVAALVVSDDNRRYLEYAFPHLRVVRLHNAVDGDLFRHDPAAKRDRLAFQLRKNPEDVRQVVNLLRFRGVLDRFDLAPIANLSESQVAEVLREARLYLAFGYPEGFSLSIAEAMAAGCVVVGFHGLGGRELLDPAFSYPVDTADCLAFAQRVEEALALWRDRPEAFEDMAARAAAFVRREYAPEREEAEVCAFWRDVLTASAV